jgi:CheY-like chemotaxis protein
MSAAIKSSYRDATILLVEDDDVDAAGIARALKKLNMPNPLIRAHNGREGLALLDDAHAVHHPYIILLDINMPCMNGLEMLAKLRQGSTLATSIVFMLTTSNAERDKSIAYEHQVAGYIVKQQEDGFMRIIEMLDRYLHVVDLPA